MRDDWSAERVADRLQIGDVLYRYCGAIDRIQPDALMEKVFHADALIDKGGAPYPVAEFVANVAARHPGVPHASHMVTNILIDFVDDDTAFVESWCLALERHPPAGSESRTVDRVYRVRYGDRFERRGDGRWRIARRTFVTDHILSSVADFALDPPAGGRIAGRRDADDAIVRLRVSLGLPRV
jgi:ketosteroid isomerase-like protein